MKKQVLLKKVKGSLFKGYTYKECADKIINSVLLTHVQPIHYNYVSDNIFDIENKRFGIGDTFWKLSNNLKELKDGFHNMDKNCFSLKIDLRTLKLPPEVMVYIVDNLPEDIFSLTYN